MKRIFDGILDSDRQARYYDRLADKMRFKGRIASAIIVIASSSAVASLLVKAPQWTAAIIFAVVAVVAVWAYLAGYERKAAISALVAKHCDSITISWKRLWEEQDDISDVLDRIEALEERMNEVTSWYDGEEDQKLNKQCQAESDRVIAQEFGS